jgi:putative ABC transport system permease protein
VGFFSDRLQAGLWRDARQLIGGDAVVVSDKPTAENFLQKAKQLGLKTNATLSFPSMARADDAQGGETKLVALKAVSEGYPLRGQLTLLSAEGASPSDKPKSQATRQVPSSGQAWVDPALLDVLNIKFGDKLWLGDKAFQISAH